MFEKNLNIGFLLDFYGDVLSERRRTVLDYYYNDERVSAIVKMMLDAGEISWDKETFGHTAVFIYTKN